MKGVHAAVAERLPEEEGIVHPRLGKVAVHGDLHIPYLLVPHLVMGRPYRLDESVRAACLQNMGWPSRTNADCKRASG